MFLTVYHSELVQLVTFFTKVVRCVMQYLRNQGFMVIMYLDDGMCGASDIGRVHLFSITVQNVLKSAGFLIAEDKCNWLPSHNVTWLGLEWNMAQGVVYVTERKISKLMNTLEVIFDKIRRNKAMISARCLASVGGQIISMQGAMGPVVRLLTRSLYDCLLARAGWDAPVIVNSKAVDEIIFWMENTAILNGRDLSIIEQYSSIVYSDASGTGYGGYVVNIIDNEVMGRWDSVEGIQSSTWRELEAVYRVLLSLLDILQGQKVKWYTDNQNIVHILNKGSRKIDLQQIFIKIANVCTLHNIVLLPQWVPREENVKADKISKSTIDRFVSDYNTKCKVFNSKYWCPGMTGINAFDQYWGQENNWIVPPPSVAQKCMQKMKQETRNS